MHANGALIRFGSFGGHHSSAEEAIAPVLARVAAFALCEDPSPDYVGLVAEAGTHAARRCRTLIEQVAGVELELTAFAGVLTIADLVQILGDRLSERDLRWLVEPSRTDLRFVICTSRGIQFAAVELL